MSCLKGKFQKFCSFYISELHLVTMLLPYVSKEIDEGTEIKPILEKNLEREIKVLITKLNLSPDKNQKIMQINWKKNDLSKYEKLQKFLNEQIKTNKKVDLIINGKYEFIEKVNANIKQYKIQNAKKLKEIELNIINCYEVNEFYSMKEVLDKHDKIINTSGEVEIQAMFPDYVPPEEYHKIVND